MWGKETPAVEPRESDGSSAALEAKIDELRGELLAQLGEIRGQLERGNGRAQQ